ncbi:MAG: DNA/RNA endonuclease G [uncultured Sulfurovum sp.]|uniref:Endonuclease n=1 Tax=uncultured Sulfurovum sp. TaxID=269237 RepID=A0A6S6SC89_9BACT|nr:MAG: DNA/RNA endonuclease G [uncultured Sulfurovum sp.]
MYKKILAIFIFTVPLFSITLSEFINDTDCDQTINNGFINICYDYTLKSPKAVSYTLDGDLVNELNIEERPYLSIESSVPSEYRASYYDYTNSGYDRGHLASHGSWNWSQESLDAVYTLANIIPQAPNVNRYTWVKAERYERFVAVQRGTVNVVNVVMYSANPERIGDNQIAVPLAYCKVLYSDDQNYTKCLYYKNDNNISTKLDDLGEHEIVCDFTDTDSDGYIDSIDTDDDNDGVIDVNDALPFNSNEYIDTDGDGIGNNADTDDDNDGVSDTDEIEDGTNPLDSSDVKTSSENKKYAPILMGDIFVIVPYN